MRNGVSQKSDRPTKKARKHPTEIPLTVLCGFILKVLPPKAELARTENKSAQNVTIR